MLRWRWSSRTAAPIVAALLSSPYRTKLHQNTRAEHRENSRYRTITDKELTLVQICCDFVCACIALPLSLFLLSQLSAVAVNAPGQLVSNIQLDSIFPVAVVIALASGRRLPRDPSPAAAERVPRNPRARLRRRRGLRARTRHRVVAARPLRHVRATYENGERSTGTAELDQGGASIVRHFRSSQRRPWVTLAWSLTAGSALASAATTLSARARLHAQLVSHVTTGATRRRRCP